MDFSNKIFHGDSLDLLDKLPTGLIDLTITSPPYFNARQYSQYKSYEDYLQFLTNIFTKVHNVTKEGRFLIVNTSPVLVKRTKRTGQSKRYAIPFDLNPILVNMGWDFIDDIIWKKPEGAAINRNGNFYQIRKPLSYKPNIVTEYVMVYRKRSVNNLGWNINQYTKDEQIESLVKGEYERSNVWDIPPTYNKNHNAVFPYKLPYELIRLYSYKNDLIFDPFGGVGTTMVAARDLNRKYLICEKNDVYFKHIKDTYENSGMFDDPVSEYLKVSEIK